MKPPPTPALATPTMQRVGLGAIAAGWDVHRAICQILSRTARAHDFRRERAAAPTRMAACTCRARHVRAEFVWAARRTRRPKSAPKPGDRCVGDGGRQRAFLLRQ